MNENFWERRCKKKKQVLTFLILKIIFLSILCLFNFFYYFIFKSISKCFQRDLRESLLVLPNAAAAVYSCLSNLSQKTKELKLFSCTWILFLRISQQYKMWSPLTSVCVNVCVWLWGVLIFDAKNPFFHLIESRKLENQLT
jgi:hypothetical protein